MKIVKARESMSARERVIRTFNHEKTDRVTIGYEANEAIHQRLCKHLGLSPDDMESLNQALGVDYRPVNTPYTGAPLFDVPMGRRVNQLEGSIMRWIENQSGGYWDFCDFPLKDADDEQFERFPVPDPDDFDYQAAFEQCRQNQQMYALYIGSPGMPDIINSNGRLMGMEDVLCHLATEHEPVIRLIRRRADAQLEILHRTLDACQGMVDFMWIGEDLGTQHAPMISLDLYRTMLKPIHKQFADLAASYKIPVIIHSCGSSSWVYDDLIEIGITGVDTLQPEAKDMQPSYLKEKFGSRLCFRGCISTAGPLAYGTEDEVEQTCKETLAIMMKGYGYHFAPTHVIQDNTPVENVIAMYNAAHKYGVYQS